MRLVTKTIWRAFPELDRFDDGQCRRFVRAAARGWLGRGVRWVLVLIALGVGLAAMPGVLQLEQGVVRMGWVGEARLGPLLKKPRWMGEYVYLLLMLVAVMGGGAALAAVTRDVTLRLQVRRVLRTRGRCSGCRYFLGGLPVGEGKGVVCPECGTETEVDESLGELRREGETVRFEPSAAMVMASDPEVARRKLRKLGERIVLGVAAVVVVLAATAGWWEWRIRAQAARAAALKPGAAGLRELVARGASVRPGSSGSASGSVGLTHVRDAQNKVVNELFPDGLPVVEKSHIALYGRYVLAEFPEQSGVPQRNLDVSRAESLRTLRAFEAAGVFEVVREFVDNGSLPLPVAPAQAPLGAAINWSGYSEVLRLAEWEHARMRLALREENPAAFEAALEDALGLARVLERQPLPISLMCACGVEKGAMALARAAMTEKRGAAWVDAVERAFQRRPPAAGGALAFEGEKVLARDGICSVFADPGAARLGIHSPGLKTALGVARLTANPGQRLGTLEENLRACDSLLDAVIAASVKPRSVRPALPTPPADLLLTAELSVGGWQSQLDATDVRELHRLALPVLIALERYRLAKGGYPASLGELIPVYITAVPVDPLSGRLLLYRRVGEKTDPQGRGFLLYSVGGDGKDDGGAQTDVPFNALHGIGGVPADYIVNNSN